MLIKALARITLDYLEFTKRHRVAGFLLSLLLLAASIGGLYLVAKGIPDILNMPCFSGCHK